MSLILDTCKRLLDGENVSKEDQQALNLYLMLPDNIQSILKTGWVQPKVMICYRSITQKARRTREYFKNYQAQPLAFLEYVLGQVIGAPPMISQHQTNTYLSLEGELLALYIQLQGRNGFVQQYLQRVIGLQHIPQQIRGHYLLKVMMSMFEQLIQLRKKYTPQSSQKPSLTRFLVSYAPLINPFLDRMTEYIFQNLQNLHDPYNIISNLAETQDSFLRALQQSQHAEKAEVFRISAQKVSVFRWQQSSFLKWVQFYCKIVIAILIKGKDGILVKNKKSVGDISKLAGKCITLIGQIFRILRQSYQRRPLQSVLIQYMKQSITRYLIMPYISQFYDNTSPSQSPLFKNQLQTQFHISFLLLLTNNRSLIKSYCRQGKLIKKYGQCLFLHKQKITDEQQYINMLNYCEYVIESYQINYVDFSQCPVGLGVKLMYMFGSVCWQIVSKDGGQEREEQEGEQEDERKRRRFDKIQRDLQVGYKNFFINFVDQKVIKNYRVQFDGGQQDDEIDGNDLKQFIHEYLNYYFQDLASFVPILISNCETDIDFRLQRPKKNNNKNIFSLLRQKQAFKKKKKKYNEKNDEKQKQEMQEIVEMQSSEQQQQVYGGAQFLWQILDYVKFRRQQQGNQEELSFIEEDDPFDNPNTLNQQQQNQYAHEMIFQNMIAVLSLFRALAKTVSNSSIRAQLFYDFFSLNEQIRITEYRIFQKKAITCKLYIVQCFLQQILPQKFITQGQSASDILSILQTSFQISLVDFVIDIDGIVNQCLINVDRGSLDDGKEKRKAGKKEGEVEGRLGIDDIERGNRTDQLLYQYGIGIIEHVVRCVCLRFAYQCQQRQYCNAKVAQRILTKFKFIFETLRILQIQWPQSYRKLLQMAGYIINLHNPIVLYDYYQKLKSQTIFSPKFKKSPHKYTILYLSGITGLLQGLQNKQLFRAAVEIIIKQFQMLMNQKIIIMDEDNYEYYMMFYNAVLNGKLFGILQDSLGLAVYDMLHDKLDRLLQYAYSTEHEQMCMGLYYKLTKTTHLHTLNPIPPCIDLSKYNTLLNQYFQLITRVPDIQTLQPYCKNTIQYLITFLQTKVQKGQPYYDLDLRQIGINFCMKRKEYLVKLAKLISIAMGMDFGEVKDRIGVARVEVDNVYYRVHLDGKEHWGYGNGEQGEDDDE